MKIMSLSILVFSLIFGMVTFYIISDLSKEQKKSQIDEFFSQLVNFIIFLWISKVILNIRTLLEDPVAILAYPSDSQALYLAILFSALHLIYKAYRVKMDVLHFMKSSSFILIAGSFFFEFLQYIVTNNKLSFGGLILHGFLLILLFFLQGKFTIQWYLTLLLICWTLGLFILSTFQPYVSFFGYMMSPWFLSILLVIGITFLLLSKRKGAGDDWN